MRAMALLFVCIALSPATTQSQPTLTPPRYLELKLEADAKWAAGDRAGALPLYRRLQAANPGDGDLAMRLALCLHAAGRSDEARPLAVRAMDMGFANVPRLCWALAQQAATSGDRTGAIDWIERAIESGWEDRAWLKTDEAFDSLRDDPRFRTLAGYAPAGLTDRVDGWRYDLDFFVAESQRMHAGPDRPAWSPGFLEAIEALKRRVATLDDAAVALELQKIIVAWFADGHSVVYPMPTDKVRFSGMLPVSFYFFGDAMYVVRAHEPHQDLVGMRVDAIGGKPTVGVVEALAKVVSRDNDQGIRWIGPLYLRSPEVLRAIGYLDALGGVALSLTGRDGTARQVTLLPGPLRELNETLPPPPTGPAPRWLARVHEPYWLEARPELDAVYVQFNQVTEADDGPSLGVFATQVREALRASGAAQLVIDVRHNNGGDNHLLKPLIGLVNWHSFAGGSHRTFVLTGRRTFSACQNFINHLERHTDAIFVGERSSGKPNSAGENTTVQLPWSGLNLSISARWFQDGAPGDARPYIPVAMPVELSFDDWWAGKDSVMDALAEFVKDSTGK